MQTKHKKVMLLAAGRGERMRPLTDTIPKPLVEVGGRSLIGWHLKRLAACGLCEVVINYAHLGDKIVEALGNGTKIGASITYSPEPCGGLETAGGIIQALPLLKGADFVVLNADIWTNYSFKKLDERHLSDSLAHLVLVDTPSFKEKGDFFLDEKGAVNVDGRGKHLTFSGISLMSAKLFAQCEKGRLPLLPVLQQAINNKQVTGEHFSGEWRDIGTLQRLDELQKTFN